MTTNGRAYALKLSPQEQVLAALGFLHLETAVLQGIHEIQFAARDVERALGVHHHADAAAFDQDVAAGRLVLQIHFVLQARAAAADDGHAQDAVGPALLLQKRTDLLGGGRD